MSFAQKPGGGGGDPLDMGYFRALDYSWTIPASSPIKQSVVIDCGFSPESFCGSNYNYSWGNMMWRKNGFVTQGMIIRPSTGLAQTTMTVTTDGTILTILFDFPTTSRVTDCRLSITGRAIE